MVLRLQELDETDALDIVPGAISGGSCWSVSCL